MTTTELDRPPRPVPAAPPPRSRLAVASSVAVLVAAVAVVVSGVLWVLSATSGSTTLAAERDAALVAARDAAVTLNTLDHHDPAGGLDRWQAVSTGTALDEFRTYHDQYVELVGQAKRSTKATVTDAAVAELNERAGTARVLVGVDVTVTVDGQPPVLTRERLQLAMVRVDDTWKVDKVGAVRTPGR